MTELEIERAQVDLLKGKLNRAYWVFRNLDYLVGCVIEIDTRPDELSLRAAIKSIGKSFKERQKEIQDCLKEISLEESGWVPKKWLDRAEGQLAKDAVLWKQYAVDHTLVERQKEEITRLKAELEYQTTNKQRLSYYDAIRYRDLKIKELNSKLKKQGEVIKELKGGKVIEDIP